MERDVYVVKLLVSLQRLALLSVTGESHPCECRQQGCHVTVFAGELMSFNKRL